MPDRHGPMKTGRFEVRIDDVEVPGWTAVDLPSRTTAETEYREGDSDAESRTVTGQTEFDDLEMERGVKPGDTKLWDWRRDVEAGRIEDARKSIRVALKDEEGNDGMVWEFTDAWVKGYEPPELDAGSDGGVAIESVTVKFDKMKRAK